MLELFKLEQMLIGYQLFCHSLAGKKIWNWFQRYCSCSYCYSCGVDFSIINLQMVFVSCLHWASGSIRPQQLI